MDKQTLDDIYRDDNYDYTILSKELYKAYCITSLNLLEKLQSDLSIRDSIILDYKFEAELATIMRWFYIFILSSKHSEKLSLQEIINEFWEIDSKISEFTGKFYKKVRKIINKRFNKYSRAMFSLQPFEKLSVEFLDLINIRANSNKINTKDYFTSLFESIYNAQNESITLLIKEYSSKDNL